MPAASKALKSKRFMKPLREQLPHALRPRELRRVVVRAEADRRPTDVLSRVPSMRFWWIATFTSAALSAKRKKNSPNDPKARPKSSAQRASRAHCVRPS
jgi:hypothetical protein